MSRLMWVVVSIAVGGFSVGIFLMIGDALARQEAAASANLRTYRNTHPDAVECRKRGGFPVWSNWSGAFIDCKPFPRAEPTEVSR